MTATPSAMTAPAPAIAVTDLAKTYDGKPVFRNVSFVLAPGEKATLTGPSGCGKSTVLRCLLGFALPEQGRIAIEGTELSPATVWRLRARMAYVDQEPDLGDGAVADALERPFHFRVNAHKRDRLSEAPVLFERFGLAPDLTDKSLSALSGGEKQRVALIGALLLDRPILLLDEATSALDGDSKAIVNACIAEMTDLTVLSVSHDPAGLMFADRLIDLRPGAANTAPQGDA